MVRSGCASDDGEEMIQMMPFSRHRPKSTRQAGCSRPLLLSAGILRAKKWVGNDTFPTSLVITDFARLHHHDCALTTLLHPLLRPVVAIIRALSAATAAFS